MDSSNFNVSLAEVITAISQRQPVLNQADLDSAQLQTVFTGIGSLDKATSSQISFLTDKAYAAALSSTSAAAILISSEFAELVPTKSIAILVASPYLAYASISHLFDPLSASNSLSVATTFATTASTSFTESKTSRFIHPTAQIAKTAIIADDVVIGPFCVIEDNVRIASGTRLYSNIHIEESAEIGSQCVIYANVFIGHRSEIGNKVRIHAGASIGSEGFGFAPTVDTANDGWERIVQLGRVIIGNNVRIGSQTCIDRGAIENTVIEDNVIIDNLVQIGHNVKIGAGTAIAGNAGIAGSATIGKRCMIGGGVGIAGHLQIADSVVLTGMTMVSKSIKKSGVYSSGVSSMPAMDWRRAMVMLKKMGKKDG